MILHLLRIYKNAARSCDFRVVFLLAFSASLMIVLSGCNNMRDQPRYEALEASQFFPDGRSARPLVDNTVPRELEVGRDPFYTGKDENGAYLSELPIPLDKNLLERGKEQFDIYCSPCHGLDGYGQGIIVQRGFSPPPSFHSDRLRQIQLGYIFDVITNGFQRMYSYGDRVATEDRWAITAYIRALQLSQNADIANLPADVQDQIRKIEQ